MSTKSNGKSLTIRGRIVWAVGDIFKGKPSLDQNTKQPKYDKQGRQLIQYGFGLAVPKTVDGQPNAELNAFFQACQGEAMQIYPNGHIPPAFAFKYKDGDKDIDEKAVPYSQREGYPGHIVFAMTSFMPIKYFKWDQGKNMMIDTGIKSGDYLNVQVMVQAHGPVGTGKPGMYLNPNAAQLIGYGTAIVSKSYEVDADSIFGNAAPTAFQGASQMPPAPTGGFPTAPQGFQPHTGILPQHLQQAPVQQFGQPMGNAQPVNTAPQNFNQMASAPQPAGGTFPFNQGQQQQAPQGFGQPMQQPTGFPFGQR